MKRIFRALTVLLVGLFLFGLNNQKGEERAVQPIAPLVGKDLEHVPDMMEALVWEAAKEQPDLLIVSGDLTFNGEYQSLVELAAFFERIEKMGRRSV